MSGGQVRRCKRCTLYMKSQPGRVAGAGFRNRAEDWFDDKVYLSKRWTNEDAWSCNQCPMWWRIHYKALVITLMKLGVRI